MNYANMVSTTSLSSAIVILDVAIKGWYDSHNMLTCECLMDDAVFDTVFNVNEGDTAGRIMAGVTKLVIVAEEFLSPTQYLKERLRSMI